MEGGVSGVLRGIGDTKNFCYRVKYVIIRYLSFDYVNFPFGRIGSYRFFLNLVFFSPILVHNATLSLLYCPLDEESVFSLRPSSLHGVLVRRTILRIFIYFSDVLI